MNHKNQLLIIKEEKENILIQIEKCPDLQEKIAELMGNFLIKKNVLEVGDITEETRLSFHKYILLNPTLTDSEKRRYKNILEKLQFFYYRKMFETLEAEVNSVDIEKCISNKILFYLMDQGINTISDMNYKIRVKFENYLKHTIAPKKANEYIKGYDKIKLSAIKRDMQKYSLKKNKLEFVNDKIFLLYHPDYEIANSFYYQNDKEELVFDFSYPGYELLKNQIFEMLVHVLNVKKNQHDRRERFLIPLKKLYLFCMEKGIRDIEQMTDYDEENFRNSMSGKVGTKEEIYMQIVYNIRKFLFLNAKTINFDANVWYLERFTFKNDRVDAARPIETISFAGIKIEENRRLLQEYMKNAISITHKSIKTILGRLYDILEFLKYCDQKDLLIQMIGRKEINDYLIHINEKKLLAVSHNKKVMSLKMFLSFLTNKGISVQGGIVKELDLKKVYVKHYDHKLDDDICFQILSNLNCLEEQVKLIFLNIFTTPFRISEVCKLKGNAFFMDNGDCWVRVHQTKTKNTKQVPIPKALFEEMKKYIKINSIMDDEYIFKNKKGGPYSAENFSKKMKTFCEENKIKYNFRTHEFRHKLITDYYNKGIPIQTLRELAGHRNTEMTKHYVDFLEKRVREHRNKYYENDYILNKENMHDE